MKIILLIIHFWIPTSDPFRPEEHFEQYVEPTLEKCMIDKLDLLLEFVDTNITAECLEVER